MANLGPASVATVNTQPPRSTLQTIQTIAVSLTPSAIGAAGSSEQTFTGLGTGLVAGDVILSVNSPSVVAAVALCNARVDTTTADKFYITWLATAAATPAAGTYLITVGRVIPSVSTTPGTLSSLPSSVTSN